ncbi:MAG: hypothetical protein ACRD4K_06785, partial [Candidatus Acidiferrales bacterium]
MDPRERPTITWIDIVFFLFLAGLAALSPIREIHKQFTLLAIGVFQLLEGSLIQRLPRRGPSYSVLIKILLASLLIDHTGQLGINSSYYQIYYVPILTAAIYFRYVGTLLWTTLASLAYCSFLIPALQEYEFTPSGASELAIRILFFYLADVLVNSLV